MLERAQSIRAMPGEKTGGLYSLGGVLLAVCLYSALHITARLIASGNLGEDDPLEAILTQTLALGYLPGQPPLYDWALWLIERVTGPGALPFQLLKYSLLTATCGFIFLAARRVMKGDAFWAFLSVEALALIYQISWRFHEGFTHAVGAMCAVAATFWALLRLIERGRLADFARIRPVRRAGRADGEDLLDLSRRAHPCSLLCSPRSDECCCGRAFGIAVAVAALIVAPHSIWLARTPEGIAAMLPWVRRRQYWRARSSRAGRHTPRLYRADHVSVAAAVPLPAVLPRLASIPMENGARRTRCRRYAGLRAASAASDAHQCRGADRGARCFSAFSATPCMRLMPMFLLTSIWLTAQARNAAPDRRQVRRFVIMAASVALFAFCARAANMYVLEPVCSICRWGVPYAALAQEIKRQGFETGRILVFEEDLGGNMRRFFPDARIELAGEDAYVPPRPAPRAKTALLWSADSDSLDVAARFEPLFVPRPGDRLADAIRIDVPWRRHFWKPDGYRVSSWRLYIAD